MVYGNLTRDPELRALPSGGAVASFALATNRIYKKGDGSRAEETTFHNIIVFGKTAEACSAHLRKGSSAYVEGRIQTRSWDKDGTKQYRTEIVAENVQFGPRRDVAPEEDVDQRPPSERATTDQPEAKSEGIEYPPDMNPDDIPF